MLERGSCTTATPSTSGRATRSSIFRTWAPLSPSSRNCQKHLSTTTRRRWRSRASESTSEENMSEGSRKKTRRGRGRIPTPKREADTRNATGALLKRKITKEARETREKRNTRAAQGAKATRGTRKMRSARGNKSMSATRETRGSKEAPSTSGKISRPRQLCWCSALPTSSPAETWVSK